MRSDVRRGYVRDMKWVALAIALVTALSLVAGCGSASNTGPSSLSLKPYTTTTLRDVRTGTLIRCVGIADARVPAPGKQVTSITNNAGASGYIEVKHKANGLVRVDCSGVAGQRRQ